MDQKHATLTYKESHIQCACDVEACTELGLKKKGPRTKFNISIKIS